ncbi:protein spaetzle 4-like [Tetranychus urticae]|uniref:protein spaetzle 4-like n=1 Tax=Tetranychus urticae TaxID=32264 RepID=UPI00077BCB5B|nr:protein spaetzle 4-like [Tetranychus urticae]
MLIPFIFEVITVLFNITPILAQSTCGPKVSARLLMDIPCDMSKSNFCELSGTIYPWAAVRRYIYENQGLLRRMYGDQRHYQILTNEIQDLREKYDNVFINNKETKFYESNHIFNHQTPFNKYQPQFRPRSFFLEQGEEDNEEDTVLGEQDKKVESKRDDVVTSVVKSVNETQTSSIDNRTVSSENNVHSDVKTVNNETNYNQAFNLAENSEDGDNKESTTIQTPSDILTSTNVQNSPSDSEYLEAAMTTTPDYNSPPTESLDPGMTIAERFYMVASNEQKAPETSPSTISMSNGHETSSTSTSSAAPNPLTDNGSSEESNNSQPSQPSITPDPEQPKSKGVNACPVREEVIAPYWANNTRGEILALLNVYPFEQYVHWEKCAHENSQMFCRDGCRCEQQYRLHRLLAFDPKNECRGIFADWFRFPSCCVCICYDLPESNIFYRTTKRKSRL